MEKFWYEDNMSIEEIQCYEALDNIDLKKELLSFRGKRLRDAMDHMEFNFEVSEDIPIFNAISEYEFHCYLNSRYGDHYCVEENACFIN